MHNVFIILLSFSALSAYAADYTTGVKCPTHVKHVPSADVSYQGGVSASGYGVAPAEEVPPALTVEDFQQVGMGLNIPVSNVAAQVGNYSNFDDSETQLNVAVVNTNAKTGEVTFNGRDITAIDAGYANPECW